MSETTLRPPSMPTVCLANWVGTCRDLASALSSGKSPIALVGPSGSGKTYTLTAFSRPLSSLKQRAAVRTVDQHLDEDITVDLVDDVDAFGLARLVTEPQSKVRQVVALHPDALSAFQASFPGSPIVHVRLMTSADVRVLLNARRTMLGRPLGSITVRATNLLERLCSGSPGKFDQLFMRAAFEAPSASRISVEHVERAASFLQSQSVEYPASKPLAALTNGAEKFPANGADKLYGVVSSLADGHAVAPRPAADEQEARMPSAVLGGGNTLNTDASVSSLDAVPLVELQPAAPQLTQTRSPDDQPPAMALSQSKSAWAHLTRPQTIGEAETAAHQAKKAAQAIRRYSVLRVVKFAVSGLLVASVIGMFGVLNPRGAARDAFASLNRLIMKLDGARPDLTAYRLAGVQSRQPDFDPRTAISAEAGSYPLAMPGTALTSQVATHPIAPLEDMLSGRTSEMPLKGDGSRNVDATAVTEEPSAKALSFTEEAPTVRASTDLSTGDMRAALPASPPQPAQDGKRDLTIVAAVEAPVDASSGQRRNVNPAEANRLLTLGKTLILIGQPADAGEMLKVSAKLGNKEAALLLLLNYRAASR